jgi:hypothetical protein
LKVLYVNDPETAQRWDRVTGKKYTPFKITEKDFTIDRNCDVLPLCLGDLLNHTT